MDELDQIARQVARDGGTDASLDVETLLAYRAGQLDEAQTAEVERRLAQDPAARAFLAEQSAPAPPFLLRWAKSQRRKRYTAWVAGAALAAAAVLFFVLRPAPGPAPEYRIDAIRGGLADVRGDGDAGVATVEVDAQSGLTIALKPIGSAHQAPTVEVLARSEAGQFTLPHQVETGAGGAVRLSITGAAFPRPGRYTVKVGLRYDGDPQWLTFTVVRVEP